MTKFDKSLFSYHGGFLVYRGEYEGRPVYEAGPMVHPSNVGRGKDLFIARFKYRGPFTKAVFLKELLKNFTVEEYAEASKKDAPLAVLRNKNPEWYEKILAKVA